MKTIIAGSRTVPEYSIVEDAIKASGFEITEVVSGTCRGPDQWGEEWARRNSIPVKQFPAEWRLKGRAAGILRNEDMGDYADALIAVWDGTSRGTQHMINYARAKGLKVFVWE
jgi:hypothetical protein